MFLLVDDYFLAEWSEVTGQADMVCDSSGFFKT